MYAIFLTCYAILHYQKKISKLRGFPRPFSVRCKLLCGTKPKFGGDLLCSLYLPATTTHYNTQHLTKFYIRSGKERKLGKQIFGCGGRTKPSMQVTEDKSTVIGTVCCRVRGYKTLLFVLPRVTNRSISQRTSPTTNEQQHNDFSSDTNILLLRG